MPRIRLAAEQIITKLRQAASYGHQQRLDCPRFIPFHYFHEPTLSQVQDLIEFP